MILKYGGIHKKVGLLIQRSGGYDEEYYITKLAEELQLDRDTVSMLFKEAPRINLSHYIGLLKQGVPADKIFEMVYEDRRMALKKLQSVVSVFSTIISSQYY